MFPQVPLRARTARGLDSEERRRAIIGARCGLALLVVGCSHRHPDRAGRGVRRDLARGHGPNNIQGSALEFRVRARLGGRGRAARGLKSPRGWATSGTPMAPTAATERLHADERMWAGNGAWLPTLWLKQSLRSSTYPLVRVLAAFSTFPFRRRVTSRRCCGSADHHVERHIRFVLR